MGVRRTSSRRLIICSILATLLPVSGHADITCQPGQCFSPIYSRSMTFAEQNRLNVIGTELKPCGGSGRTGFYRNGFCHTGPNDHGIHVVCAKVTDAFLRYSKNRGNDLITPNPDFRFPGLKDGDHWCLCASRWLEAYKAGVAPPVVLQATHHKALEIVPLDALTEHASDMQENASSTASKP